MPSSVPPIPNDKHIKHVEWKQMRTSQDDYEDIKFNVWNEF